MARITQKERGATKGVRFCLLPMAQRFALQHSGANLTGKHFRVAHPSPAPEALSREIGARMLAGGRPWGGGKIAGYQRALR